jgi:hypothetical protein
MRIIEMPLERKSSVSGLEKRVMAVGVPPC